MRLSRRGLWLSLGAFLLHGCGGSTAPPPPAAVSAASTASLTGIAGSPVMPAPSVTVTSSNGTPVPNVVVTFAVTVGGGSLTGGSATTNSNGIATVGSWTLGTTAGANAMTATVGAVPTIPPVTFTAIGAAGPPAKIALRTAPSSSSGDRAPFPIQPVVELQDVNGNVSGQSGVSVTASITAGGGTLGGTTTVATASNGLASFTNLSIAGIAGIRTVTFSAAGLSNTVGAPVTTTAGSASTIAVSAGNSQSATQGTAVPIPPAALVTDADGNPVGGVPVTFTAASCAGSVAGPSQTTNASGVATVTSWTLGPSTGTNTLTATASGVSSPATFTATATTNPATVAYGGSADKVAVLDPGGSYTPTISIANAGVAQAVTVATYTSRATSVATVDVNGKITGVAAGESWVVASYSAAKDSVFVQVTRSAAGPVLHSDLTTYVTTSGTLLTVNFTFDPRTTSVGSALVAVGFETENSMFTPPGAPAPSATVATQTPQPVAYSAMFGVYRSTVASAAGLSSPVVMLQLQATTGSKCLAGWLTFTALSVAGTDGSDITSSTTSTRYPIIIR